MRLRISLVVATTALLAGCVDRLPLALAPDTPVQVAEVGGSQYTVNPSSEAHLTLERWVTNNRSGWSPYYATLPAKGITVRSGTLDLQFLDSHVFAQTSKGAFRKAVTPTEY